MCSAVRVKFTRCVFCVRDCCAIYLLKPIFVTGLCRRTHRLRRLPSNQLLRYCGRWCGLWQDSGRAIGGRRCVLAIPSCCWMFGRCTVPTWTCGLCDGQGKLLSTTCLSTTGRREVARARGQATGQRSVSILCSYRRHWTHTRRNGMLVAAASTGPLATAQQWERRTPPPQRTVVPTASDRVVRPGR